MKALSQRKKSISVLKMIWASKDVYQLQYLMIITRAIDNFTVGKFFDSAQSSSVKNFKNPPTSCLHSK